MLQVHEIYRTVLGESRDAGRLCGIVRLTGCHRRCVWCDSAHAFQGGEGLDRDAVLARVGALGVGLVLLTGGEPLLQAECPQLAADLLAAGYDVVIETSGTRGAAPLASLPAGARRVVDVKTPGSGIPAEEIDWEGLAGLGPEDELKFVVGDRADYDWTRRLLAGGRLPAEPVRTLSPVHGVLDPGELAGWVVADALDVRVQVQLHKVLWPGRDRGV